METILGIDLGTTNSVVSIIRDGDITVLEEDGQKMLPSVPPAGGGTGKATPQILLYSCGKKRTGTGTLCPSIPFWGEGENPCGAHQGCPSPSFTRITLF